jgi:hypothetical protein
MNWSENKSPGVNGLRIMVNPGYMRESFLEHVLALLRPEGKSLELYASENSAANGGFTRVVMRTTTGNEDDGPRGMKTMASVRTAQSNGVDHRREV